jgi:hypothetical protein
MELEVLEDRQGLDLEDGLHYGVITECHVEERGKYTYLDVVIQPDELEGQTLKCGYPLPIRPSSMAGELFKRFGFDLESGEVVETDSLVNKSVQFLTLKGEKYIEVERKSVKPSATKKQGVLA